jgi:hypothetical protein
MYFLDTATAVESVHEFWVSLEADLPNDVHIQVEDSGDVLDSETGDLTGTWVSDGVDIVDGGASTGYSAASGAVVDWLTSTIADSKRLRGKSFIVPLAGGAYTAAGVLNSTFVTALEAYGATLISTQSTSFVVWHRGTGTNGSVGLITSAHVPNTVAVLRSRRD